MFAAEYEGINNFLVEASKLLLKYGVERKTRNQICYELPEPFMFKIPNPTARWVTIPDRKWNSFLPYAESLWLASGRNDMAFITRYLRRMNDFSDDKISMRGGYGPRLRYFDGTIVDYAVSSSYKPKSDSVDQFRYIVDSFDSDPYTRRAIINIDDTMKDEYDDDGNFKDTLDVPCTRLLHFQRDASTGKLNLTVFMRSNDFLWGASAVNIFNFTFMQEYFAAILGLEVGSYYHIADNFHFYEDKREMIERLAAVEDYNEVPYTYNKSFNSLKGFDNYVGMLEREESAMVNEDYHYKPEIFKDEFFRDWYSMLYRKNFPYNEVEFVNPCLYKLAR